MREIYMYKKERTRVRGVEGEKIEREWEKKKKKVEREIKQEKESPETV